MRFLEPGGTSFSAFPLSLARSLSLSSSLFVVGSTILSRRGVEVDALIAPASPTAQSVFCPRLPRQFLTDELINKKKKKERLTNRRFRRTRRRSESPRLISRLGRYKQRATNSPKPSDVHSIVLRVCVCVYIYGDIALIQCPQRLKHERCCVRMNNTGQCIRA